MRAIHTSDWHLGRALMGADLGAAQAAVLDALCRFVAEPPDGVPVDVVLVAGDVFDRGVPPVESMELFESVLERLVSVCHVVVTSGNHDSARRLGFGAGLFRERLHLVTDLAAVDRPVLVTGSDGVTAAVYAFPYLEPDEARGVFGTAERPVARSHEAVVSAAMDRVRADVAARADRGATGAALGATGAARTVVMAHAFVTGGAPSPSERTISVGGVESVSARCFAGVDYVALGHLHRPQEIAGPAGTVVRYPGSPLRYSFEEAAQVKGFLVVDLPAAGPIVVTPQELPQPRGMAVLRDSLTALVSSPAYGRYADDWVRLEVTDDVRPERMIPRLRERFPHALQFAHDPANRIDVPAVPTTRRGEDDVRELGADFIAYVTAREASDTEVALFETAAERARRRIAAAGA